MGWNYALARRETIEPSTPPISFAAVSDWLLDLAAVGFTPSPALIASASNPFGTLDYAANLVRLDDGRILLNAPTASATFRAAAEALAISERDFDARDLTAQRPDHATVVEWREEQAQYGLAGSDRLWPDRTWQAAPQLELGPAPLGPWYSTAAVEVEHYAIYGDQAKPTDYTPTAGEVWVESVVDRIARLTSTAGELRRRAATIADICANPCKAMGPTRQEQKKTVYQRGSTRGDYAAALNLIMVAAQELWLGLRQTDDVVTAETASVRPVIRSIGVYAS